MKFVYCELEGFEISSHSYDVSIKGADLELMVVEIVSNCIFVSLSVKLSVYRMDIKFSS